MTYESDAGAKAAAAAGAVTIGKESVKVEGTRGRVYVGGLAEGTADADLKAAMSQFGALVSADVRNTSGFVVYTTASAADAAIAAGTVTVNGTAARIETPRPRRRRGPKPE